MFSSLAAILFGIHYNMIHHALTHTHTYTYTAHVYVLKWTQTAYNKLMQSRIPHSINHVPPKRPHPSPFISHTHRAQITI